MIGPGTAKTFLPNSRPKFAVIRLPESLAPSVTKIPLDNPATIRFRAGKLPTEGGVPGGYSEIIKLPLSNISS
ncbi:MAG: hypothetical protein ACD_37C00329G0001 [uncultured bacterium]|nr:MAG: hypothetical protein ACD_37C00329G0001 [uncultured bacterium]